MLEKTLESPLGCKEIKPVSPKGNQSWIFIGRTDPETEAPVLWSPDVKSWLIRKDVIVGKDWKQQEKGTAEDAKMDSITDSVDMNLSKLRETVKDRGAWCTAVHGTQSRMRQRLNSNNNSFCACNRVFNQSYLFQMNWVQNQLKYQLFFLCVLHAKSSRVQLFAVIWSIDL